MDSSRLGHALRSGFGAYGTARAATQRGTDLAQWGKLSGAMATIAADATDKRRRLWRMKVPALAVAASAAVAIWILLVRDTIPEDQRSSADMLAAFAAMVLSEMLRLPARWHLESRVAGARKQILQPPFLAQDGAPIDFAPDHVLTVDGVMVAAIDPGRRLIRVIAPVFFGFDVVFPVDAAIHSVRLTEPKLVEQPAVVNMPSVSDDIHVASTMLIFIDDAEEPARFTIPEPDIRAAEKWLEAFARWMREDRQSAGA